MIRLVQFLTEDSVRRVAVAESEGRDLVGLDGVSRVAELAEKALRESMTLAAAVEAHLGSDRHDYGAALASGRVLPPIDHDEPARLRITGTGLTHLGSADTRDAMHVAETGEDATPSMRMFRAGLEGGKPAHGEIGAQPEWFYKGDGGIIAAPEAPLEMPAFSRDGGEEPELAGIYLIAPDGTPVRLGFALANEFSDHVTERQNYLLLAHSKLRAFAFGPELRLGALPDDIRGVSRIRRGNAVLWEKPFLTGEANMSHTIANLEHHHFKYPQHRRPGDIHVHVFGTATLSFADGVTAQDGDLFEIEADGFGRPLRNPLKTATDEGLIAVHAL